MNGQGEKNVGVFCLAFPCAKVDTLRLFRRVSMANSQRWVSVRYIRDAGDRTRSGCLLRETLRASVSGGSQGTTCIYTAPFSEAKEEQVVETAFILASPTCSFPFLVSYLLSGPA